MFAHGDGLKGLEGLDKVLGAIAAFSLGAVCILVVGLVWLIWTLTIAGIVITHIKPIPSWLLITSWLTLAVNVLLFITAVVLFGLAAFGVTQL